VAKNSQAEIAEVGDLNKALRWAEDQANTQPNNEKAQGKLRHLTEAVKNESTYFSEVSQEIWNLRLGARADGTLEITRWAINAIVREPILPTLPPIHLKPSTGPQPPILTSTSQPKSSPSAPVWVPTADDIIEMEYVTKREQEFQDELTEVTTGKKSLLE
jgi:hypothetical protein